MNPVVVLAGGTGGAKLARGMLEVVGDDELVVIANTGDDTEIYSAYVSPDPDLVTFWLADRIDERGWGLADDTFRVMDGLRELGVEVWFNLGDLDLAIGLERATALAAGTRLTDAHAELVTRLGVRARVLPMADEPVRTRVLAHGRWWPLQEFLILGRGQGPVDDVEFRGAAAASPTAEALEAIASARAIVIGPSNPVISIGPILAVPGMRDAILAARSRGVPVVAVSGIIGGKALKGPADRMLASLGRDSSAVGVAREYAAIADAFVLDDVDAATADAIEALGMRTLVTDTIMVDATARARLAGEVLEFARTRSGG